MMNKTERGFDYIEFVDCYGKKCSLQKSSLATEDCVWLGIDDPEPQILATKAHLYGIETDKVFGWIPWELPDDVLISTRMHLSIDDAEKLIERLQIFVDTGDLS